MAVYVHNESGKVVIIDTEYEYLDAPKIVIANSLEELISALE